MAHGQQPQTSTAPVFSANAKYVQGVGPGYWPTAGSGLTLNLAPGTATCGDPPAVVSYAGGTLAMTDGTTNYVYLDPAASCAPTVNTTGFEIGQIPLATVVTAGGAITSITDARNWFQPSPCAMNSTGALNCSALGTNQDIHLNPSGTGGFYVNTAGSPMAAFTGGDDGGGYSEFGVWATGTGILPFIDLFNVTDSKVFGTIEAMQPQGMKIIARDGLTLSTVLNNSDITLTPHGTGSNVLNGTTRAKNLNGTRGASHFAGANAGVKITEAMADLPATGGVVDARGLEGAQILGTLTIGKAGTTLLLGAGTYTGQIHVTASNVQVIGLGAASVVTATPDTDIIVVDNAATDVLVEKLYVQGQATVGTTTQIGLQVTRGAGRATVRNCRFGGTSASTGNNVHIYLNLSDHNIVTENTFDKSIGDALIKGYSILLDGSNYNQITGNTSIYDATDGRHHIYLSAGSSYNLVEGNTLYGGRQVQIKIYSIEATAATQYNQIIGNTLIGMRAGIGALAGAIFVQQKSYYNTLAHNKIIDPEPTGILILGSSVGGESTSDSNEIVDNMVVGAHGAGIQLRAANSNLVENNWIHNAGSAATNYGIHILSSTNTSDNNVIDDNRVTGTTHDYAFYVLPTAPTPSGTRVANNRFSPGVSGTAFFTPTPVTFSATPTFDASLGNPMKITLTANVTSSTLVNATAGQIIKFIICQDGTGGHTFVWPTNVKGGMTIGGTASTCSAQSFIFDGTDAYALSPGVTNM